MHLKGKQVLVVGLGRSGIAVAEKLNTLGAHVTGSDCQVNPAFKGKLKRLAEKGVQMELGKQDAEVLKRSDLVIVSPGVPGDIPLLAEAKRKGIPIWSEIELAYRLTEASIIAITGTNGKTTTTALIGQIFERAGLPVVVAGNIGFPLIRAIDQATRDTVLVTEVSSFQLEHIEDFAPRIAILLNISEDHLDRHGSLEDYQRAKGRLFANQTAGDFAVINMDDEHSWALAKSVKSRLVPYSCRKEVDIGVFESDGKIWGKVTGEKTFIAETKEIRMKGRHNLENALAASATTLIWQIPPYVIKETLRNFSGLEHRLEYVGSIDGVQFYNDSKATNPGATLRALQAFDNPVVLLAGGRNKGMDMSIMSSEVRDRARAVVLFGEAASEIEEALSGVGPTQRSAPTGRGGRLCPPVIEHANSLEEAVKKAHSYARPGDVVLLSPACASFDMFENFEERGKVFKEAVKRLGFPAPHTKSR
jgi:UDP-N-acetylmuramoylalanine--D-glutamate ligase